MRYRGQMCTFADVVSHQQWPGSAGPHGYRVTTRRRRGPGRDPRASHCEVPVFDHAIWEESAGPEDAARAMEEEEESFDENEWLQAEAEVALRRPLGAGVIIVDDGGVGI